MKKLLIILLFLFGLNLHAELTVENRLKNIFQVEIVDKVSNGVPEKWQMSLISVGGKINGKAVLASNGNELIGKLGEDYAKIGEMIFPIKTTYLATNKEESYIIMVGPEALIVLEDFIPKKGESKVGRYVLSILSAKTETYLIIK